VIIVAAVAMAAVSNYFITGYYNLVPWVIIGFLIGFIGETRRNTIIFGAVLGYVLFLVYIYLQYHGKTDLKSMTIFMTIDMLFSLVGGGCGLVGALIGRWLKGKIRKLIIGFR